MPRKLPLYVERIRTRFAKDLYYFRRGKGKRIRLPSPDSADFLETYQAALAGMVSQTAAKPLKLVEPGTIAALIRSYQKSSEWHGLRETTKAGYLSRLRILEDKHGHRLVSQMTRERIVTRILQPYAEKPGQALAILKMLRVLINHAITIEWLKHDPSKGIRRPKTAEIRSWTEAEIAHFEARWPIETKQRLAFGLMLFTGQRRSDVHRMTWADIADGKIGVSQQKTGEKLKIRIHSDLAEILDFANRYHVTILNTEFGRPFTVDGFSRFMRDAIESAGLPLDCQPHGLRKAAGRRLANAGCSAKQIMAVLGHKSLAECERYVREAEQEGLADDAVKALEGQKVIRLPKPTQKGLGKIGKSKGKSKLTKHGWRSLREQATAAGLA